MALRSDIAKLKIQIRTNLDRGKLEEAQQGLAKLFGAVQRLKKEGPFKKQQTQIVRNFTKEIKLAADAARTGSAAAKSWALRMINLRDAGSAFVIQAQKIDQLMTELRETFLGFDEARQQFLVLGDAVDTAIGKQAVEAAQRLALEFAVSSEDVIKGMRDVAAMGVTAADSVAFMESALFAASAGMGDAGETAQTLLNIIRAFGLEVTDANTVAAQLAFIANETSLNMQEMTTAMQFAGAQAGQMGFDIAETASLLGVMRDAGLAASMAGTTLRQFMVRIQAPTSEARGLLEGLGIEVTDLDGNFLQLSDILGNVDRATQDLTTAERAEIIATLFQTRGQQAFNLTMATGLEDLENLIGATRAYQDEQTAVNFLTVTSEAMLDNQAAAWRRLDERQTQAARTIAENVVPAEMALRNAQIGFLEALAQTDPRIQGATGFLMGFAKVGLQSAGNIFLLTTSFLTAGRAMKSTFLPMMQAGILRLKAMNLQAIITSKGLMLAAGAMGALVFGMLAFQQESPGLRAMFSVLTGASIALAAANFLAAAGLAGLTLGAAVVGIAAAVAAVIFLAATATQGINQSIGAQQGLLIDQDRREGVFINDVGQTELISPVPIMRETVREVIREEGGAGGIAWHGDLIVEGSVITSEDLKETFRTFVIDELRELQ